ncbi:hypothetical protein VTK26DRAFT_7294 [Humicola hyalothermophila]
MENQEPESRCGSSNMDLDSDFYGDEKTVSALEARVENFDFVSWWASRRPVLANGSNNQQHPSTNTATTTFTTAPANTPQGRLHNPYEGEPYAWDFAEPISSFLSRLPPATTDWRPGHDWIWVANPYQPPHERPDQALTCFLKGGRERLAHFSDFEQTASAAAAASRSATARAIVSQDVDKERREAVADLQRLAVACGVLTGKWMLFPEPGNVNEVWGKVARATAGGELGVGAKVATRVDPEKARLICIYTRDFRDKDDVARVLNRMRELELVRPGERQIYYKTDAWTHLDIYGGNGWGIAASMYSSNQIFSYIRTLSSRAA